MFSDFSPSEKNKEYKWEEVSNVACKKFVSCFSVPNQCSAIKSYCFEEIDRFLKVLWFKT